MFRPRVYVDTSVIGGCFDPEFEEWSCGLMEDFRTGRFRIVLSDVIAAEVALAPTSVRELYAELLAIAEMVSVTDEVVEILATYEERLLPTLPAMFSQRHGLPGYFPLVFPFFS